MSGTDFQRWICDACGYIYDEAKGDPDSGLAPGTRYQDIPDDWQCPLCGLTKADLRLLPEAPPVANVIIRPKTAASNRSKGSDKHIVIIGAGIAGWSVSEAIRRRDPDTPILLIAACKGLVYPKPAISLAISQGRTADDLVETDAASRAAELNIEVRTETKVIKIDSKRKRITTAKGGIEYGKLVLALGAHQRELEIEGNAAESVLRVNDLLSFKRLQQRLDGGSKSVTILGAGLIGSEFADDLSRAGHKVTVIDPGTLPLADLLPEPMSKELLHRLEKNGVEWQFGQTLKRLEKDGERLQAELSCGDTYQTDLVVSAAGLVANKQLAAKSGLCTDTGITVNSDMQTSNHYIYAIGDCASVEGRLFAYIEPIRRQAEAIAANLAGEHERFMPIPPMVKVKTQSMPISICSPFHHASDESWKQVNSVRPGLHFEIASESNVVGFALSDELASTAGDHYRKLIG